MPTHPETILHLFAFPGVMNWIYFIAATHLFNAVPPIAVHFFDLIQDSGIQTGIVTSRS